MYVQSQCSEPNSNTPVAQADIDAENLMIAVVGQNFTHGNADLAGIIAALTPPAPSGSCQDLTNTATVAVSTPFPWPAPPGSSAVPTSVSAPPAGSSVASSSGSVQQAAAPVPANYWTASGGPSSYPWVGVQRAAGRLVPAWRCEGARASAATPTIADMIQQAVSKPGFWTLVIGVAAAAWALSATEGRRRGVRR